MRRRGSAKWPRRAFEGPEKKALPGPDLETPSGRRTCSSRSQTPAKPRNPRGVSLLGAAPPPPAPPPSAGPRTGRGRRGQPPGEHQRPGRAAGAHQGPCPLAGTAARPAGARPAAAAAPGAGPCPRGQGDRGCQLRARRAKSALAPSGRNRCWRRARPPASPGHTRLTREAQPINSSPRPLSGSLPGGLCSPGRGGGAGRRRGGWGHRPLVG